MKNSLVNPITIILLISLPQLLNAQWVKTNGLEGVQVSCLISNEGNLFAGTRDSGVYLSKNNGNSWTPVNNGLKNYSVQSLLQNDNYLFAATDSGIYRSANNGKIWSIIDSTINSYTWSWARENFLGKATKLFLSGPKLFASTDNYAFSSGGGINYSILYVSNDFGDSWTKVPLFQNCFMSFTAVGGKVITFCDSIYNRVYSAFNCYQSTDVDTTWLKISTLPAAIISSLTYNSTIFVGSLSDGIFFSKNNGLSWSPCDSGLPVSTGVYTFANSDSTIFSGTSRGIFLSNDDGSLWTPINSGLPLNSIARSLKVSGSNLFAIIDSNGIWRRSLPEIVRTNNPKFKKKQNKVTAFNLSAPTRSYPYLAISFSNPNSERVTIRIYNLSGTTIATLFNSNLSSGPHSLLWDTKYIPTGYYTLEMVSGSNCFVKSLPIIR